MRKLIIKSAFVAAFIAVAGYAAYNTQKDAKMSDLAMANVEALAGGESGGKVDCCPDPGDECKLSSGDVLHGQDEC
ncbi:MAG: NVEALA domain-containing protein [Phocaeicola sp.]